MFVEAYTLNSAFLHALLSVLKIIYLCWVGIVRIIDYQWTRDTQVLNTLQVSPQSYETALFVRTSFTLTANLRLVKQ